ncbi:MAG: hypothetical protein ACOX4G_00590 [Limnochordia bacterium]
MKLWRFVSVSAILTAITTCAAVSLATVGLAAPRLCLVVTDSLDLMEIATDASWQQLVSQGSIGLINTRTAGRVHAAATHLSIGASFRADAPTGAVLALDASELFQGLEAGAAFTALTQQAPVQDGVMVLSLPQLQRANTFATSEAGVGWLGRQLREKGLSVALVGNSDTLDNTRRPSALIAMDEEGRIPLGNVSKELFRTDPEWPFGRRTDYEALSETLSRYRHVDLLAIELGDLARLDAYRDRISEQQWQRWRRRAVQEMGEFITKLLQKWKTPLLVVAPTPRADRLTAGHWLAPALLVEPRTQPGLLSSRNTRRAGIAVNIELAAVVLALVEGNPPEPWFSQPHPNAMAILASDYQHITSTHDQRKPVLQSYVILCIIVFSVSMLIIWATTYGGLRRPAVWHITLLSIAAFPLALLILPLVVPSSATEALVVAGAIAIALALGGWYLGRRSLHSYLIVLSTTSAALCLDLMCRTNLIQRSILGYDCIGGARYYGIGNEYVGVLLTSSVMVAGMLLQTYAHRLARPIAILFLGLVALVVGAPWWGANNGGALAAFVGFSLTILLITEAPITWRQLLRIALGIAVAAGAAIAVDLFMWPQSPSHLGLLARRVATEGLEPLVTTASRKIAMNLRLFRYTIWTRVLVVSLAITLWLLHRPAAWVRQLLKRFPVVLAATKGALITAVVALLVNDSGVVAAATAMIPVTTVLLFLAIAPVSQQE